MYERLLPMMLILLAGYGWQRLAPGGVPLAQMRTALNALLINLLVPALILGVFLNARPEPALYRIPLVATAVILSGMGVSVLLFGWMHRRGYLTRPQAGAAILAASFGNGLGAAVAVMEGLYGAGSGMTRVPLLYEMLANLPITWSLGVWVCSRYGSSGVTGWRSALVILRLPPFWAVVLALALGFARVPVPAALITTFSTLGQAAVPLLLFVVGTTFALRGLGQWQVLVPVVLIRHGLAVLVAVLAARAVGLDGSLLVATGITAAASSVAVGIAICERFKLDSALFGAALTMTTLLYVLIAPWLHAGLASHG